MSYNSIKPGQVWLNTEGKRIQAHGGSVMYVAGMYYWYGENKEKTTGDSLIWHWGVRAYASKDLYNWEDKGIIIPLETENLDSPLHPHAHMDRPHILYNKSTKKYVCWLKVMGHSEDEGDSQKETILIADNILGPYTTHFPLFSPPFVREAPAHFRRKGKHYLITSGTTGYLPNPSEVSVADTWHGPFKVLGNPYVGDESNTSFHSQISCIFKVEGKKDLYIACADRWLPEMMDLKYEIYGKLFKDAFNQDSKSDETIQALSDYVGDDSCRNTAIANYVWLPLRFDGEMVYIDWMDEWRIEDFE